MMDGPRTSPGRDGALSSPAERLRHAHILKRGSGDLASKSFADETVGLPTVSSAKLLDAKSRIAPTSSPEGAQRSGAAAIARSAELGRFVRRLVWLWPLDDA